MRETTSTVSSTHRQALDAIIASLRYSGLWVFKDVSVWENIYKIYNKTIIIIVCIFAITVFTDLCFNYDDLIILTDDGCILAGISVIIFKIFNFQKRSERIKSVIQTIHTPIDALNRSSDLGVRTIVQTCSFYEKVLLRCFWAIGGILSIALIFLVPVEEGDLPIRARYPFDVKKFPMHHVAFFLQAYAVSIGLIAIIGMDSMVIGLYKWINVQLVVLNANYENCLNSKSVRANISLKNVSSIETKECFLVSNNSKRVSDKIACFVPFNDNEARVIHDDDSFVRRFKTCIKHHQRLISGVDELNELFGSGMSVQLFASFSMICLTGFQAVLGAKNLSSLLKFSVYLGAAFSQLLNWCWTGNALLYQWQCYIYKYLISRMVVEHFQSAIIRLVDLAVLGSATLTTSQWLSGWEDNHTPEVISLMIISMMRSKEPLKLQASKFYTMSMETFIAILRNSYSFFALLTEMNDIDQ